MPIQKEDTSKIIRIDGVTHRKLKIISATEDKTLAEVVEKLVDQTPPKPEEETC